MFHAIIRMENFSRLTPDLYWIRHFTSYDPISLICVTRMFLHYQYSTYILPTYIFSSWMHDERDRKLEVAEQPFCHFLLYSIRMKSSFPILMKAKTQFSKKKREKSLTSSWGMKKVTCKKIRSKVSGAFTEPEYPRSPLSPIFQRKKISSARFGFFMTLTKFAKRVFIQRYAHR